MEDWAINDRNVKALAQLIRKYELPPPGGS
jgi:hypothetical protein